MNKQLQTIIIAIISTIIVILLYDTTADNSISLNTKEWECTQFTKDIHMIGNKEITINRCSQWTLEK